MFILFFFKGGKISINKKDSFDFSISSAYTANFFTYYKNNKHFSEEITEGNCLYLIFSLCWVDHDGNNGINQGNLEEKLSNSLMHFTISNRNIAILLEKEYKDISIEKNGYNALREKDKERFDLLKSAIDKLPADRKLKLFIVRAELEMNFLVDVCEADEDDSYDESFYDILEESERNWLDNGKSVSITKWFEISGKKNKWPKENLNGFLYKIIDPNDKSNNPFFEDLQNPKLWNKTRHVRINSDDCDDAVGKTLTYYKHMLVIKS